MRKATQRAAAVSAAVLGIALVGTGCSTAAKEDQRCAEFGQLGRILSRIGGEFGDLVSGHGPW